MRTFLLYLLTTSLAFGQDSVRTVPARVILKLAPMVALDIDRTVQAGLEYRVGNRTAIQTELGYGWPGLFGSDSYYRNVPEAEILRVRQEFRWYTGHYRRNKHLGIDVRSAPPLGNYYALDLLFKQINVVQPEAVYTYRPQQGESVPPKFEVLGTMRTRLLAFAAHAVVGRQIVLFQLGTNKNKPLLLDTYFGLGVRKTIVTEFRQRSGLENAYYVNGERFAFRFKETNELWPSLRAGFKLGYPF